jgi:hypothetical protein
MQTHYFATSKHPMTTEQPIYSNSVANVSIFEVGDKLRVELPIETNKVYLKAFTKVGGVSSETEAKDMAVWIFDKSKVAQIKLINQMINSDVSTLYKVKSDEPTVPSIEVKLATKLASMPVLPARSPTKPLQAPKPGAPRVTPSVETKIVNVPSPNKRVMPPPPPGSGISAEILAAASTAATSKGSGEEGTYPRLIYQDPNYPEMWIADYTPPSMVLFCPPKWGKENTDALQQAGGKSNWNYKTDQEGKTTAYGWVFAKSNVKGMEFLSQLAGGIDLLALAPPPSQGQRTWGRGRGRGSSFKPVFTSGESKQGPQLPTARVGGIPKPGSAIPKPVTPPKPETPVDLLIKLVEKLNQPMAKATVQNIGESPYDFRVGFFGPKSAVETMVSEYMTTYPTSGYSTGVDFDVTTATGRVVIVSRSKSSD